MGSGGYIFMRQIIIFILLSGGILLGCQPEAPTIPGYRGIWFTLGQFSEYGDKYSGGLGTYTAKHHPLAIYAPEVDKTFFVYGGTTVANERRLLAMASYFDHKTRRVPRPVIVHDKQEVNDPHDNPSLSIDGQGHLWVFVSGRARARPGFVYRSRVPYDLSSFELMKEDEFTYPQPWWVPEQGFMLLFTKYTEGRELYWAVSPDGVDWSSAQKLVAGGHYQMSNRSGSRIATAFNAHPRFTYVDGRTNLYYLETSDMGATWTTVTGMPVQPPLDAFDNPALVRDYAAESRLVYLKDIGFDAAGRPVLLYITSNNHVPGPEGIPRTWTLAKWSGSNWDFTEITSAHHNYDMGSLYTENNEEWRLIIPTEPGPQYWGTGGEMALWVSVDHGITWTEQRKITAGSARNHAYARRPVDAHPDFYAFWADGNPDTLSPSYLYFTNVSGDHVWQLPYTMDGQYEKMDSSFRSN